jgi:hypothetical protein
MYSKPVLQDWANQMGATLPEDVIIGDLNIEDALESTYLFC